MTVLTDARSHLTKAQEFLDAATSSLAAGHNNAAASNAVMSGINAKDAICLRLTGKSSKSDAHVAARMELRGAGPTGKAVEPAFGRLLGLKQKSQYEAGSVSRSDAGNAVKWAALIVAAAQSVVTS